MQQPKEVEAPTGAALRGEQASEFWVWIWSTIDQSAPDELVHERDEAQRLAVAFERATSLLSQGWPGDRFASDQGPVSTALLAHYLLTRSEHLVACERRQRVVTQAAALLNALLRVDARAWPEHFERLGVALGKRSVFRPESRQGITIESLDEGPALPGELEARRLLATQRWEAEWQAEHDRPKRRRQLEEASS